eukprot:1392524-Amorphochlora_amoeboformis.AAC.1
MVVVVMGVPVVMGVAVAIGVTVVAGMGVIVVMAVMDGYDGYMSVWLSNDLMRSLDLCVHSLAIFSSTSEYATTENIASQ